MNRSDDLPQPFADDASRSPCAGGPMVSFLIATFDVADYVVQCLESAVHQTYGDYEVIVVDDASTDGTWEIVRRFAACCPKLKAIRHERNLGLSDARNTAMEAARGKYLAFLDGDDWACPDMLATLVETAERTGAEVVAAEFRTFDENRGTFGPLPTGDPAAAAVFDPRSNPLRFEMHCAVPKKLCLRSLVREIGFRFAPRHPYQDVRFHFALALHASRVAVIRRSVYNYRVGRPGQATDRTDARVLKAFDSFVANEEWLSRGHASAAHWRCLLAGETYVTEWIKQRTRGEIRRAVRETAAAHFARLPPATLADFLRHGSIPHVARLLRILDGADSDGWEDVPARAYRVRASELKYRLGSWSYAVGRVVHKIGRLGERLRNLAAAGLAFLDRLRRRAGSGAVLAGGRAESHDIQGKTLRIFEPRGASSARAEVEALRRDEPLFGFVPFAPGDVVTHLGAGSGVFALTVALHRPWVRVFAVEPDPVRFDLLRRNIAANGVSNVIAVRCAVGDPRRADGSAEVVSPADFFAAHGIARCRMLAISAPRALRSILAGIPAGSVDFVSATASADELAADDLPSLLEHAADGWCVRPAGPGGVPVHFRGLRRPAIAPTHPAARAA